MCLVPVQGLMNVVQESTDKYDEEKDKDLEMEDEGIRCDHIA